MMRKLAYYGFFFAISAAVHWAVIRPRLEDLQAKEQAIEIAAIVQEMQALTAEVADFAKAAEEAAAAPVPEPPAEIATAEPAETKPAEQPVAEVPPEREDAEKPQTEPKEFVDQPNPEVERAKQDLIAERQRVATEAKERAKEHDQQQEELARQQETLDQAKQEIDKAKRDLAASDAARTQTLDEKLAQMDEERARLAEQRDEMAKREAERQREHESRMAQFEAAEQRLATQATVAVKEAERAKVEAERFVAVERDRAARAVAIERERTQEAERAKVALAATAAAKEREVQAEREARASAERRAVQAEQQGKEREAQLVGRLSQLRDYSDYGREAAVQEIDAEKVPTLDLAGRSRVDFLDLMKFYGMELVSYAAENPGACVVHIEIAGESSESMARVDPASFMKPFARRAVFLRGSYWDELADRVGRDYWKGSVRPVVALVLPHRTAHYFAWKQKKALAKAGLDTREVRVCYGRYEKTAQQTWVVEISHVETFDGRRIVIDR